MIDKLLVQICVFMWLWKKITTYGFKPAIFPQ